MRNGTSMVSNKFGTCVVCNWTTVTTIKLGNDLVYCCSDRTCKDQFTDAILSAIDSESKYSTVQGEN